MFTTIGALIPMSLQALGRGIRVIELLGVAGPASSAVTAEPASLTIEVCPTPEATASSFKACDDMISPEGVPSSGDIPVGKFLNCLGEVHSITSSSGWYSTLLSQQSRLTYCFGGRHTSNMRAKLNNFIPFIANLFE